LISRHAPHIEEGIAKGIKDEPSIREAAKPAPKKKNKPMTKSEQERKLEHIGKQMEEFQKQGSQSQEPVMPSKLSSG
jgi:bromodomain-containing factor 1